MVIRSLFIPHWSSVFKNIGNKSLKRDIEVFFCSNYNLCSTKKQPLLTKRCSCVQQRHYASDRPTVREKAGDLIDSNQDVKKKPHFLKAFDGIRRDYLNIEEVVSVLRENMCEDLCVIKVDSSKTGFHYVDYFVVTSGRSIRHMKSMAFLLCSKVMYNLSAHFWLHKCILGKSYRSFMVEKSRNHTNIQFFFDYLSAMP